MADEAQITLNLQINADNVQYRPTPTAFNATVTGRKGPTPGSIAVAVAGTDVDLSQLTTPGLCRIMNQDDTNYVSYGIWDGSSFYPLGELLPGEFTILRLARNLGEEYGVGTGTSGAGVNALRFKADTAECNVLVDAFEK